MRRLGGMSLAQVGYGNHLMLTQLSSTTFELQIPFFLKSPVYTKNSWSEMAEPFSQVGSLGTASWNAKTVTTRIVIPF